MSLVLFKNSNAARLKKDLGDSVVSGDPEQHVVPVYPADKDGFRAGIWECAAGSFKADYTGITEFCHVLDGGAVITTDAGEVFEVTAGDAFVLVQGMKTTWTVETYIKKHYVICEAT